MSIEIKIIPNDTGTPPGKLADAELHFRDGLLAGLKLIGFAVWQRRDGGQNVTFPARSYTVQGERRSFALLRPTAEATAQQAIREAILQAWAEYERQGQASLEGLGREAAKRQVVSDDGVYPVADDKGWTF